MLSYQNLFRLENFFILSFVNANGNSAPKYCRNVTLLYLSAKVNAQASDVANVFLRKHFTQTLTGL